MILECPSCHARYLVHIGSFAGGGRHVRCARCKHQWHASLPTTIDVFVPLPPEPAPVPDSPPPASPPPPLASSPPSAMPSALAQTEPLPGGINLHLPAIIKDGKWRGPFGIFLKGFWIFVKVALVLTAILIWPIMDRQKITTVMPQMRGVYDFFHLNIAHSGEALIFDKVKSELKYDSGMMRLIVDGVIHNTSDNMQFVPDIKARAIGPDNHIIQSWWIPAPAATIEATSDLPFHTEVNAAMKETIENVYLEFYAQDEKPDVAE